MVALFWIAAAVAVISTLMVVTRLDAVHALLYLIVSLLSVAVIFYLLGAPFIALLEVILYAGAIMVLFIFTLMMLNLGRLTREQESRWLQPRMWIGPSSLAAILVVEMVCILTGSEGAYSTGIVPPKAFARGLFGPYLLAVELASILLMAGLVGAYHLGSDWKERR
jgi:NADH-quinone oxidoreductase subunit J